jgi:hypothetical protein
LHLFGLKAVHFVPTLSCFLCFQQIRSQQLPALHAGLLASLCKPARNSFAVHLLRPCWSPRAAGKRLHSTSVFQGKLTTCTLCPCVNGLITRHFLRQWLLVISPGARCAVGRAAVCFFSTSNFKKMVELTACFLSILMPYLAGSIQLFFIEAYYRPARSFYFKNTMLNPLV